MPGAGSFFQLSLTCGPDVIHDELNGDVIVIHLPTGAYYALTKEGSAAWGAMVDREVDIELGDPRLPLMAAFMAEGLVTGSLPPAEPDPQRAFMKYVDLEDILLADPIHDVDESGWPQIRGQ
jgi:hypothetical protein